jgi:hypothetical protein
MSPFLARRQYNTPILYIAVQRIACTDIEAAPKWPGKNDLSLRGNFGLHGKTILPSSRADFATHHLPRFQRLQRQADKTFNAFFTTKPDGIGMGFRIRAYHRGVPWRRLVGLRQPTTSARSEFVCKSRAAIARALIVHCETMLPIGNIIRFGR